PAIPAGPTTLVRPAGAGHGHGAVAVATVADFAPAIADDPAAVLDPQLAAAVKTDNEVGAAIPNRVSAGHDDRAFTVRVAADIAAVIFPPAPGPDYPRCRCGISRHSGPRHWTGCRLRNREGGPVATGGCLLPPPRPRCP